MQLPRGELAQLRARAGNDPLGLFLDGKFLDGVPADIEPLDEDALRFELVRNNENQATWDRLLGGHIFDALPIPIAIGVKDHFDLAYKVRLYPKHPIRLGSGKLRLNAGRHYKRIDRLVHVIIGAATQSVYRGLTATHPRDHDDREFAL